MVKLEARRPDWAALKKEIHKRSNQTFSCEFQILEQPIPEAVEDQDTWPMRVD